MFSEKKSKLLLELSRHGIKECDVHGGGSLKEVEKKYTKFISGGIGQFSKNGEFDKSSYYKIDTPVGPIG